MVKGFLCGMAFGTVGLLSVTTFANPYVVKKTPDIRIIESFSDEKIGKFPTSFRTFPFQRDKAQDIYSVQSESGNSYLLALDSKFASIQVFKKFYWEAKNWPHFSWRWRASALPQGAAENKSGANDSACGIYVIFGGYTGKALKYVWSSTLPVGTSFHKKDKKITYIVAESGNKHLNSWRTVSVNVVDDFKKAYGEEPDRNPPGFGILTDGNATKTVVSCGYDDFKISKAGF